MRIVLPCSEGEVTIATDCTKPAAAAAAERWRPTLFAVRTHLALPEKYYDLGRRKRALLDSAVAAARELDIDGTFIRLTEYPHYSNGLGFVGRWTENVAQRCGLFRQLPHYQVWEDLCLWDDSRTLYLSLRHEGEQYTYARPGQAAVGETRLRMPGLAIAGTRFRWPPEA